MATRMEIEENLTAVAEQPRIELNQAGAEELATLPGIGSVLAERIITYRDEHGPFLFKEDIRQVPGIGNGLYSDVEDLLTVTVPTANELAGQEAEEEEPGNGKALEFDVSDLEQAVQEEPSGEAPAPEGVTYVTPPPLPVSATEQAMSTEEEPERETYTTPPPLPVSATEQAAPEEAAEAYAEEEGVEVEPAETEGPVAEPAPEEVTGVAEMPQRREAARERGSGWVWTALLGAVLGAVLGMVLTLLVFAGINGAVDINRSQAMTQMRGQVNELNVELDAIQGDVSTLQGDVSGLRERVEVLSGLTARMEQAEEALETFTVEIQALEDETAALTTSLNTLTDDVEVMGETLDAVEAQTEKATSFFEGLQDLMQEIFGQSPSPQGAAPETIEEVDA